MIRRLALVLCVVGSLSAVAQTTLNGAGATFPYPMYSKWFSEYHKLHPDIQFNYQSIGSGGGIRQVIAGTVEFGASDGPMTDEQLAEAQKSRGTKILHIPTVLGAVVPAYNISGVSGEVKFTPEALDEIAHFAFRVNESTENIGARRLHTIMERVLDELSFDAPEKKGEHVTIDAEYVRKMMTDIVKDQDLSRYIL